MGKGNAKGQALTHQTLVAWLLVYQIYSLWNVTQPYLPCRPLAYCPCSLNTCTNTCHSNQAGPHRSPLLHLGDIMLSSLHVNVAPPTNSPHPVPIFCEVPRPQ